MGIIWNINLADGIIGYTALYFNHFHFCRNAPIVYPVRLDITSIIFCLTAASLAHFIHLNLENRAGLAWLVAVLAAHHWNGCSFFPSPYVYFDALGSFVCGAF